MRIRTLAFSSQAAFSCKSAYLSRKCTNLIRSFSRKRLCCEGWAVCCNCRPLFKALPPPPPPLIDAQLHTEQWFTNWKRFMTYMITSRNLIYVCNLDVPFISFNVSNSYLKFSTKMASSSLKRVRSKSIFLEPFSKIMKPPGYAAQCVTYHS